MKKVSYSRDQDSHKVSDDFEIWLYCTFPGQDPEYPNTTGGGGGGGGMGG